MTYAEFSAELNIIYENINKNGAPGLDGYEKSVILTHAQDLLVKETVGTNPTMFPQLINIVEHNPTAGVTDFNGGTMFPGVSDGANKVLKILNEIVEDATDTFTVIPLTPLQYDMKAMSPYKYPRRRTAWRIENTDINNVNHVEIIPRPNVTLLKYRVRYIKKPKPIIVENLASISNFATGIVGNYTYAGTMTGYTVGTRLTLNGVSNSPVFQVTSVNAGVITGLTMLYNGFGMTSTTYNTTFVAGTGAGTGCTIAVVATNSYTIDGDYLPQTSELDASFHRDIVKIAASLAEQYYYDKYGTDGDKRQN